MTKVMEAVWNEDLGLLQVVLEDGVVEHIYPTEESPAPTRCEGECKNHRIFVNEKYIPLGYAYSQIEKLLYEKPVEYAELVLNGELKHYVKLCNDEAKGFKEMGLDREFVMYES